MRLALLLLLVGLAAACSPKRMGINRMADALTSTASTFARDDDPEFVRVAAPSTLKMVEMLLEEQPTHAGLLVTACSGFTQYAYAFLQVEAELTEASSPGVARELRDRAARMYDRAREYCFRHLELRHPEVRRALASDPRAGLAGAGAVDVPVLYWGAAAWGAALGLADTPLTRVGELASVRAMLERALALDEDWERGALHEGMIALEGLPRWLGGSPDRARRHFDRAVELSGGQSAFAYVALATGVARPANDRAEYERLLRAALAIDTAATPDLRLANLVAQRRARHLLEQRF